VDKVFDICSVFDYNISMGIALAPKNYSVLFLDMNSFFASVEQQVRPDLRGLPVGVAPYTGDSGCIIAASTEAKKQGVKICRITEAKKIIPNIKILEARPALYMIYHQEIKKTIEKFTPFYKVLSVDEFALKLTPSEQNLESSLKLANNLKEAIKKNVGDYLSCSIGIGPNKFLAKMAAERKKPDGLTVVTLDQLSGFYSKIKLTDITGINFRMEHCLHHFQIKNPLDFYNCPLSYLSEKLGHLGKSWYFRLRGYEVDDFYSKTKTIGHSHVLPPELRSKNAAVSVLRKLVSKAGFRLRKENYQASGVYLSVGFINKSSFHLSKKSPAPFSDDWTFWENVLILLTKCSWNALPIHISVGTFGLMEKNATQISIFKEIEKRQNLAEALDEINDQFGADTVMPASMMKAGKTAPDRIPFGKPRYDILH
jgi:DNA polymerase-4